MAVNKTEIISLNFAWPDDYIYFNFNNIGPLNLFNVSARDDRPFVGFQIKKKILLSRYQKY